MILWQGFRTRRSTLPAAFAFGLLIILAWFAYAPGLSGGFLFDDWINLPPLGAMGPIDNWHALVTYLLSGVASITGRPVAMLSFLVDANSWPASPEPFKYTNILIHLLNGALLTWLTFRLTLLLRIDKRQAAWIALLSSGLWLLHPLMVSTTLFVVQRMAMLTATFVFVGLLCYLHGRKKLVEQRTGAAYGWMTAGVGLCGLLATLSKENGALLPLFVVIIERLVVQRSESDLRITDRSLGLRIWRSIFLYLPLSVMAGYLALQLPGMLEGYADVRNFTLGERLLTESRIVVHYLYILLIPRAYTAGLFNDNIALSTGLVHPWTTLSSIALIVGLLVLGWRTRARHPALALAIFFYFGGQVLESTIIPLELYYEHRNYLPAAFLFFPLSIWLVRGPLPARRIRALISITLVAVLAMLTWTRATLWGQPFRQAVVWAKENPHSPRAQTYLSLYLMRKGDYSAATEVLQAAAETHPNNIMLQLNLLRAACGQGHVPTRRLVQVEHALATGKTGARVSYNAIGEFIHDSKAGRCTGLHPTSVERLIDAALRNHWVGNDAGWRQNMLTLRGSLMLSEHRVPDALTQFKMALAAQPRPSAALYEAAILGSSGHPGAGLSLIKYFEGLRQWIPRGYNVAHLRSVWLHHEHYYTDQLHRMRQTLEADLRQKHDTASVAHAAPTRSRPFAGRSGPAE